MDEKKVLVLVGMPGAGKSTIVDHLEEKNIPSVYFGGITVNEVKRRGLEVNEKNEKKVREELRANEGPGVMAKRIIPEIEALFKQGYDLVVADGLYSWTEYKIFKEHYGSRALIVAIAAPRHVRHERLAVRPSRPFTEEQVTAREYAEIENIEKGGPIANADYTVVNNKGKIHLINQVDELLEEVGFIST
jgi:dephospho-CoA kinase